jgi:hypothetical protein
MTTGNRQAHLEAKIDTLKQELLTLGDLRPGTLSEQYNVCGKAGCACKADPAQARAVLQVSFVAGAQPRSCRRRRGDARQQLQLRSSPSWRPGSRQAWVSRAAVRHRARRPAGAAR